MAKRPARRKQQLAGAVPVLPVFEVMQSGEKTLAGLFNYHNEQELGLLEWSTLKHYLVTQRYLLEFAGGDVLLSALNYAFIVGFEQFLYQVQPKDHRRPIKVNGVQKHMTRLKKLVNLAVNLDWLARYPFKGYRSRHVPVDKTFLNRLELGRIEAQEIRSPRLGAVRDMFVFSCYTGLAFVDMMGLRRDQVVTGMDGGLWIRSFRQKTKTPVKTPLLPVALGIVGRYLGADVFVFPRLSNQKMNAYLKEIAHICGRQKILTFHVARHTFATTVTLSNGVPIETVSKLLGHTKLSTTQIYARVLDDKISHDMNQLKKQLEKTG